MGSIDFHIAALAGQQGFQTTDNASAAQTQDLSPLPPASQPTSVSLPGAPQDRVSLSGTFPPQRAQQAAASSGNAQSAAFTPLAKEISFPPGQSTANVFTTSTFPPAAAPADQNTASGVAAISAANSASANVIATSSAQTAAAAQSPVATAAANAAATDANASAATGVASTAPAAQTLQQLDRELQQLGIDPQSLSLITRGGMLNWINDPAALRQIVQKVESAANPSPQPAPAVVAKPEQNTASDNSSTADSSSTDSQNQNSTIAQQNATAALQFQKLQESLAPRGSSQQSSAANSTGTATPQGQRLNVSA
jgi:trimeric autotransporter adhesin